MDTTPVLYIVGAYANLLWGLLYHVANEEEKLIVCFTLAYRGGSILGALLTGKQRSRKLESVTVLVCSSLYSCYYL